MKEHKIIYRCRGGSHLYGLNRPESDEDFVSVFLPTSSELLSLEKAEIIDSSTKDSSVRRRNTAEDVDDVAYSLPKYLFLALQNNPNIVSLLFATQNNILTLEPEFKLFIDNYQKIISKQVINKFLGYALSQKDKLTVKASRFFGLRKAIDFLNTKYPDKIDTQDSIAEAADELNNILSYYRNGRCMCNSFNKGNNFRSVYDMLNKELAEYGWRVETADFKRLNYDTKYAYHLIRLLGEAKMLMTEGRIIYPITGKLRDDIVRIRSGEVLYDELMALYEQYRVEDRELEAVCTLPEMPDYEWANEILVEILSKSIVKEYAHD